MMNSCSGEMEREASMAFAQWSVVGVACKGLRAFLQGLEW